MTAGVRANVVSSFLVSKGAMIQETYALFAAWDFSRPKADNLARLQAENLIGAKNTRWIEEVRKVVHRRFDPEGRDRPLVVLAQRGCDLTVWRPLLLWHLTRDEFLLRDFLMYWLYPAFAAGTYRLRPEDVIPYFATLSERGGITEHAWSANTNEKVAGSLLKLAADFGLLEGTINRTFASCHLPEHSMLYLLHAIHAQEGSPRKVVDSPDWRMYLMAPTDVERELLRLHQFRRLEYQVAGSLIELRLPAANPLAYAERMVA